MAAGQILAGNAEPAVGRRPDAVDHRMVELAQPLGWQPVPAHLDMAEEGDPLVLQDGPQTVLQRLDLLVVGGDAVPHEAVRAGQPVQHVHPDIGHPGLLDQRLSGVDPAGAGADDGDMEHGAPLPGG